MGEQVLWKPEAKPCLLLHTGFQGFKKNGSYEAF